MDELLIEDKKYISSKQAAKMTGYAKDYIGQLCREGRVPARLVGRSWYVLETAIQDHRFGLLPTSEVGTPTSDVGAEPPVSPTWESPRYESLTDELLPSVNRLRTTDTDNSNEGAKTEEETEGSEHLQDTWKTWFDHIESTGTTETETVSPVIEETEEAETIVEEMEEEKSVDVPIHALYREPPEELLPRSIHLEDKLPSPEVVGKINNSRSRKGIIAIQVFSIIIALVAATLAVVGTGYLDEYIISNSQVRVFTGAVFYNK